MSINLYMDDVRPIPEGWRGARTVPEAANLLERRGLVDQCSLDHDMGACPECVAKNEHIGDMATPETTFAFWCPHMLDGTKLVRWMVETGNWPNFKPVVHSANPVGALRMRQLIDKFFGDPPYGPMF